MTKHLILWVDEQHVSTRQVIDTASGEVKEEKTSARELCQRLRIQYRPLTAALRNMVLYERKAKNGEQGAPVKLGDLAPFVLAPVAAGEVVNGFGIHDIAKPMRLSAETVRQLAAIFGGNNDSKTKG